MKPYRILITALALTQLVALPVSAQNASLGSSDEPLEVTADGSLEWNRAKRTFIARENAKAAQGASSIEAQILTALYREGAKSDLEIYEIKADRSVKLDNQESVAYGDHAIYDLDKGYAELTGTDLRLIRRYQT